MNIYEQSFLIFSNVTFSENEQRKNYISNSCFIIVLIIFPIRTEIIQEKRERHMWTYFIFNYIFIFIYIYLII